MFMRLEKKPILYKSFFIGSPLDCWPSWILFINDELHSIKVAYTYGEMAYLVTYSQMKKPGGENASVSAGDVRRNFNETMLTPQQEHFFSQYPDDEPVFFFEPVSVNVNDKVLNTRNISEIVGFIVSQLESPSKGDLMNADPSAVQAFRETVGGDLSQSFIYPAETWKAEDEAFFLKSGLTSDIDGASLPDSEQPKNLTENKE